jgi:Na+/melibiose symporter-like transporter
MRAPEPMMAFGLWGRRGIATANAATLLSGMALVGLTTFLPMYVQGVMAQTPLIAGFALTMMVLGWPIGATLAAKNFNRFGPRATMLLGAVLLPVGERYVRLAYTQDWRTQEFVGQKRYFHYGSFNLSYAW